MQIHLNSSNDDQLPSYPENSLCKLLAVEVDIKLEIIE